MQGRFRPLGALMSYAKKTVVLKNSDAEFNPYGIAKFEKDGSSVKLSLSLINFALDGARGFLCAVQPSKKPFVTELDLPFSSDFILDDFDFTLPVAVAVCKERNGKAVVSLYGNEQPFTDKNALLNFVTSEFLTADIYDDEVIATENYYLYEKGNEDEQTLSNCITDTICDGTAQKEESESHREPVQDEVVNCAFGKKGYYESVKDDLEILLEKSEKEVGLEKTIPESRFCRINYSADKYYVVGVIFEKGVPKYVCYGVPAKYSPTPPKELNGYCSFMPLSIFDLCGDGYFMMFQDAVTGECKSFN